VGSFSKTLFPALRIGFLIVPVSLHAVLTQIRRAADMHPPVLEQLALADFIEGGHYARHLRRMRSACRERLEALQLGAHRSCGTMLQLRPVSTGLHVVADLAADLKMDAVLRATAAEQLEVMPLSAYCRATTARAPHALVLGFGAVDPRAVTAGTQRLARALAAARPQSRGGRASSARGRVPS
jgi:GntR family transcriptional regulator / MocR family aminotransferase